jgi:hypothetical protein
MLHVLHVRVVETASYCGSSHESTCEQYQRGGVPHGVLDHNLPDGVQLRRQVGHNHSHFTLVFSNALVHQFFSPVYDYDHTPGA